MSYTCPTYACDYKFSDWEILRLYQKTTDSITCPICKSQYKLRHLTKDIPIGAIERNRNKKVLIFSLLSIPAQVWIYYTILRSII